MFLLTEKKDDIISAFYDSSNILTSTYNDSSKDLIIVFKNGGQYKYKGVPLNDYLKFELAESQGKVLNSRIKKYPFERLENLDTKPLIVQINKIKENISNKTIIN